MKAQLAVYIKELEVTLFVSKTGETVEGPRLNCRPVHTFCTPHTPESLVVSLKLLVSIFNWL